jgi:hypothetical protein
MPIRHCTNTCWINQSTAGSPQFIEMCSSSDHSAWYWSDHYIHVWSRQRERLFITFTDRTSRLFRMCRFNSSGDWQERKVRSACIFMTNCWSEWHWNRWDCIEYGLIWSSLMQISFVRQWSCEWCLNLNLIGCSIGFWPLWSISHLVHIRSHQNFLFGQWKSNHITSIVSH